MAATTSGIWNDGTTPRLNCPRGKEVETSSQRKAVLGEGQVRTSVDEIVGRVCETGGVARPSLVSGLLKVNQVPNQVPIKSDIFKDLVEFVSLSPGEFSALAEDRSGFSQELHGGMCVAKAGPY